MDPMLATIMYFAGSFVPQGWMSCDGSTLQTQQYAALFSLLGNRFGGDGVHTFNLPKIADVNGLKTIICVEGIYPSRL
jgi:microcystin-dependent protein